MKTKIQALVTAIACSVLLVGRAPAAAPTTAVVSTVASLETLQSVDQLKALFNRDTGHARLVLLLSPT